MRELESVARRYALTGREESMRASLSGESPDKVAGAVSGTYQESEKRVIIEALTRTRWNRRRASEILGISYNTLRRRIALYKLDAPVVADRFSRESSARIT